MKTKRIISMLIALTMIFSIMSIAPFTANAETYGDFKYSVLDDGTASIYAYVGTSEIINIPEEIDGYTVTQVRSLNGFGDYTSLITTISEINFPKTINSITTSAFQTRIGNEELRYYSALKSIVVDSNNADYCSEDGILFNKQKAQIGRAH